MSAIVCFLRLNTRSYVKKTEKKNARKKKRAEKKKAQKKKKAENKQNCKIATFSLSESRRTVSGSFDKASLMFR